MKSNCPKCGSNDTMEVMTLNIPENIRKDLMEYTEFKCMNCASNWVEGKLIIH
jgi:DNA-directed RNA polymerase subunit M/transcription elongation factor TFIIS